MSLVGLSITLIIALIFAFELLSAFLASRVLDTDVLVLFSLLFLALLSALLTRDRITALTLVTRRMLPATRTKKYLDFLFSRTPLYSFLFLSYFLTSLLLILLMDDDTLSRYFLMGAMVSFFPLALAPIFRSLFSSR